MLNIHHTILYFWYRLLISIRLSLSWRKSLIILDTQNIVCILVQSSETNRNTKRIHLSTDKKRLKIPMTFFHRLFDANFSNFPVTLAEKDTQIFIFVEWKSKCNFVKVNAIGKSKSNYKCWIFVFLCPFGKGFLVYNGCMKDEILDEGAWRSAGALNRLFL